MSSAKRTFQEAEGESQAVAIDYEEDRKALKAAQIFDHPANDRNSILLKNDYNFVLKLYDEHVFHADSKKAEPTKPTASTFSGNPIIFIPSAMTSTISRVNAMEFLSKGEYIDPRQVASSATAKSEMYVERPVPNSTTSRTIKFKIVDNVRLLRPEEWNNVVAVFATGDLWQFKGWQQKTENPDPAVVFSNALGVHLAIDGVPINPNIAAWNCKVIKVHQFKRHLDIVAYNDFWNELDRFISIKKPAVYQSM